MTSFDLYGRVSRNEVDFITRFFNIRNENFEYLSNEERIQCGSTCYRIAKAWGHTEMMSVLSPWYDENQPRELLSHYGLPPGFESTEEIHVIQ